MTDTVETQKLQALLRSQLRLTPMPIITNAHAVNQLENNELIFLLSANENVSWSIVGGADKQLFSVITALVMTPKAYATPIDVDHNNVYEVQIQATDAAGNFTNQAIAVSIVQAAPPPPPPPPPGGGTNAGLLYARALV